MTHVRLSNVNVRIPIYDQQGIRLLRLSSLPLLRLTSFGQSRVGTNTVSRSGSTIFIHALKDISLDLAEGDRVCLIGHNGAGKTTLLRVVAGIYPPMTGTVNVQGRTFPLLGSSMALNSDATGYENIQLMANLYNWPRKTYTDVVRDIEEFTELDEYLNLPTRVYSAGMQARLGFALATAQGSDILLIDEGIGAGDAHFQEKARARVKEFVSRAHILMLATHSIEMCRAMCNKALLLSKGEAVFFGDIEEAFKIYAGVPSTPTAMSALAKSDWHEELYLAVNPDVPAAIEREEFISGYHHFEIAGRAEKRLGGTIPADWDDGDYLKVNRDVARAVAERRFFNGYHHYLAAGSVERRQGGFPMAKRDEIADVPDAPDLLLRKKN